MQCVRNLATCFFSVGSVSSFLPSVAVDVASQGTLWFVWLNVNGFCAIAQGCLVVVVAHFFVGLFCSLLKMVNNLTLP